MAKEKSPLVEGEKYGYLTYLGNLRKEGKSKVADFQCDCGELVTKHYFSVKKVLRIGRNKPCCSVHCELAKHQYNKPRLDITGKKLNKLTALECTGRKCSNGDYLWLFQCDCGNTTEVSVGNFNGGHTQSCGCAVTENRRLREDYHGMTNTPEHKTWFKIKERCYNENEPSYFHYGAIGITMSKEWREDFKVFLHDMGLKPKDGKKYTIDRIDNTRGYEKGNCRWVTTTAQARNKLGLQNNNKTGMKGVHVDQKSEGNFYAKVTWRDLDGKPCGKAFSFNKYGEELALFLAGEYRAHMIDLLNLQGAGYSEQHLMSERHGRW